MREQLIRYLLGELDTEERRELRSQLRESPELQRELDQLRNCFAANREDAVDAPPPGRLAERTSERVSNSDEYELAAMSACSTRMSASDDAPAGVLGWSLADLTVAGGVMLAVSMLVFPALRDSRDGTRLNVCQNNQYQLWVLVTKHAIDHGGYYPQVRPNEKVGVFAAKLVRRGYIDPDELAVLLVCPSSPVAGKIRAGELRIHIPSREELRVMPPAELGQAVSGSSPCYGDRMAQFIGNEYLDARDFASIYSGFDPIFGDLAGDPQDAMKSHHRGSVIQITNRNGSLKTFTTESPPAFGRDFDLYHNYLGVVAAGIGPHDVVLAPSNAMPGLLPNER
jgi:hypothetical protein